MSFDAQRNTRRYSEQHIPHLNRVDHILERILWHYPTRILRDRNISQVLHTCHDHTRDYHKSERRFPSNYGIPYRSCTHLERYNDRSGNRDKWAHISRTKSFCNLHNKSIASPSCNLPSSGPSC
uniref:(northern house mosquito) hypothetical protein n=1 Tax=Culex pipiens TaxID=7175 RepID=A0A8D8ASL9_CULPI